MRCDSFLDDREPGGAEGVSGEDQTSPRRDRRAEEPKGRAGGRRRDRTPGARAEKSYTKNTLRVNLLSHAG